MSDTFKHFPKLSEIFEDPNLEGPSERLRAMEQGGNLSAIKAFKVQTSPTKPKTHKRPDDMEKVKMLSELYGHTAAVSKASHDANSTMSQEATQMAESLRATMLLSVRDIIEKYELNVTPMDDLIGLLGLRPELVEWATRGVSHMTKMEKESQLKFLRFLKENNWDPLAFGFSPVSSDPDVQKALDDVKQSTYEVNEETGMTQPREGATSGTSREGLKRPEVKVLSTKEALEKFPPEPIEPDDRGIVTPPLGAFGLSAHLAPPHPNLQNLDDNSEEVEVKPPAKKKKVVKKKATKKKATKRKPRKKSTTKRG